MSLLGGEILFLQQSIPRQGQFSSLSDNSNKNGLLTTAQIRLRTLHFRIIWVILKFTQSLIRMLGITTSHSAFPKSIRDLLTV